jgi:hypothetical protein
VPLLPTTSVYVRPRWHTADAGTSPGHERAHTGSDEAAWVMVRSTAGITVVSSVPVLLMPVFCMFPVSVAVLVIVEPADATTLPAMVTTIVPPGSRSLIEQVTCEATTVQPPDEPTVPPLTV